MAEPSSARLRVQPYTSRVDATAACEGLQHSQRSHMVDTPNTTCEGMPQALDDICEEVISIIMNHQSATARTVRNGRKARLGQSIGWSCWILKIQWCLGR